MPGRRGKSCAGLALFLSRRPYGYDMNGGKWGVEGPPPGAYSQVTNAQRFQPLHRVALDQLERLQERFDVERAEGYGLDQELERGALARPSVKLTPADSRAAPLVVAFTSFPGIIVRCGRWLVLSFPTCGCDACDETAESELQRLTEVVGEVVGGRFRESIRIPLLGKGKHEWALGSSVRGMSGGEVLSRSRARALVRGVSVTSEWSPWPRK